MGATPKVFGDPRHPYTQMLLSSVPQLSARWETSADRATRGGRRARRPVATDRRRPRGRRLGEPMTGARHRRRAADALVHERELRRGRARLRRRRRLGTVRRGDERGVRAARDVRERVRRGARDGRGRRLRRARPVDGAPQLALGDARARASSHAPRSSATACASSASPATSAAPPPSSSPRAASRTRSDVDLLGGMGDVLRDDLPGAEAVLREHGVRLGYENHPEARPGARCSR